MKEVVIYSLMIFLSPLLAAQPFIPSDVKKLKSLTGTIHALTIFIDTEFNQFTDEELDHFWDEQIASQNWLEEQAQNYGVRLEFDNDRFGHDHGSAVSLDENQLSQRNLKILDQVFQKMDYDGKNDFFDWHNIDRKKDKLVITLIVNLSGRSHAYNYWSAYNTDFSFVFAKNSYGRSTGHYVISHELLHQFDAWDLYFEYGNSQTIENAAVIDEKYPNSIMKTTRKSSSLINVDEVTAWRIGWIDYVEGFNQFNPKLNRKKIQEEYQARKKKSKKSKIKLSLKKKKENGGTN